MQVIPLDNTIPSQTFTINLADQDCSITLYWRFSRLFMDLKVYIDGAYETIVVGAVCLNLTSVTQFTNPKFKGSLHFVDKYGDEAPCWDGLGDRWELVYFTEDETIPERLAR